VDAPGGEGTPAGADVSDSGVVPPLQLVRHLTTLVLAPNGDPGLSPAGWRALLGLAVRERCAALAWVRAGALIARCAPPETASAWRQLYITIAARGHVQIAAASEAAGQLQRHGVYPITLKGFPLAAALYGDATARACTDIDWYVPLAERQVTRDVLRGVGWIHNGSEPPWDESFERPSSHGTMHLEVHSSLMHPRFAYLPVPAPEYEPMLVEGVTVRRQAGALLPAYLAAHLAQHQSPPLLWDIDFATLWTRSSVSERLASRRAAREAGLSRYLAWAVRRVSRVIRLAEGRSREAGALGFGGAGRIDVHPAWRHVWLAPTLPNAARAADGWLRPDWVRSAYGPGMRGVARRVAKHWRTALVRNRRVGDLAPGDGSIVPTDIMRMDGARLLELARGVVEAGGEMWIVVTGHSMQSLIRPGDRVLLGPLPALRPGVVVLANAGGKPVLHRIQRLRGDEVVLRGDALQAEDEPIRSADVIGGVRTVSRGAVIQRVPVTMPPRKRAGVS
jgi:hypothetical protein